MSAFANKKLGYCPKCGNRLVGKGIPGQFGHTGFVCPQCGAEPEPLKDDFGRKTTDFANRAYYVREEKRDS